MLAVKIKIYMQFPSRTGKQAWTFNADGPIRSSPRIAEQHIFFGSDDGYLYAVNLLSNRMTWRVDGGSPIRSSPFINKGIRLFRY